MEPRAKSSEEPRADEQQHRTTAEQIGIPWSVLDSMTAKVYLLDRNACIIRLNKSAARSLGLSVSQAMGKTASECFPSDQKLDADNREVIRSGKAMLGVEGEYVLPSGKKGWAQTDKMPYLDGDGKVAGVIIISTDITARKKAQEDLRKSEEKYRNIFERAEEGIFQTTPEGRFKSANPAMARIFGYESPEELMSSITDIRAQLYVHPDERYFDWKPDQPGNSREFPRIKREVQMYKKDGTIIWTSSLVRPVRDEAGRLLYFEGFMEDVTGWKQAEEEREKLQTQLSQAQKMESIGRLAGGVAHDFNNMLTIVTGHAQLGMMRCDSSDPIHNDLKAIEHAALQSSGLVSQLLAFARKQTIAPRILDLNETVEGMFKMLQRLIGEDISFQWKPGCDLWSPKIDPSQIEQLLVNLCVNARDAIAGVGKITVETGNAAFDDAYCGTHADFIPGQYVMLAVSDDGCGIDKAMIDQIFEPFFTTKEMGKGTGLGLATVYGIVKQNGGFINVYSEPAHGSTFRIYLPRYEGEIAEPKAVETAEAPKGSGETVLLVEDDIEILNLGRAMLEALGYTVLAADTPGEALRLARSHGSEIRLLVTDVVMPEMNGRELARQLSETIPNLKCLYSSGYTANVIAHHGVLDQGINFLEKPFSFLGLAIKVRETINGD
jgi:PAS domain S-box-containing protein